MNTSASRIRIALFVVLGVTTVSVAGLSFAHGTRDRGAQGLKSLDVDGNHAITRDEIAAAAGARFAAIDANRDGQATVEEIRSYRERLRAERQAARLARIDSDGNGRISEAEFVAKRIERMQRLDRNDDGVLDAADRGGRRPRG